MICSLMTKAVARDLGPHGLSLAGRGKAPVYVQDPETCMVHRALGRLGAFLCSVNCQWLCKEIY